MRGLRRRYIRVVGKVRRFPGDFSGGGIVFNDHHLKLTFLDANSYYFVFPQDPVLYQNLLKDR